MDAPVLGATGNYHGADKWEVTLSWRDQVSDRHFIGHQEQKNRITEHSQVINRINQSDISITRKYPNRWRLSLSIPYMIAERSSPIRDPNTNAVVDRSITSARGIGDVTLVARKWLWDPATHKGNISLGIGGKIPTGADNVVDTRASIASNGTTSLVTRTVDQSIQPGDGGFGIVFDFQAFRRFSDDRFAVYGSGTYLSNPQTTNGIRTFRSAPGEEIMSVADVYIARSGVAWYPGSGWGLTLGGRIEGVPTYDIIGSSDGFRRPGYAVSVEPGVSWTYGPHTFSLQVPIAVDRSRAVSVPDLANGTHGDAAFADYFFIGGYSRRF
jgi:hypothetical protein